MASDKRSARKSVLREVATIGLDLAKASVHFAGLDASGKVITRRQYTKGKLLEVTATMAACRIGMEACCGAHHLGRQLLAQGHDVRLMPPKYVKPFVKRDKNDSKDAEACAEACLRPTMSCVELKSAEQLDMQSVHRHRSRLVGNSTQLINQGPRVSARARHPDPAGQAALRGAAGGDPGGRRQRRLGRHPGPAGGDAGRVAGAAGEDPGAGPPAGGGIAAGRGLPAAAGGAGDRGADGDGAGGGGGERAGVRDGAGHGGLAGADAARELDRREAAAGRHQQAGEPVRADAAGALRAGGTGDAGGAAGPVGGLAAGDAGEEAAVRGDRGAGSAAGADRVGPAEQGRAVLAAARTGRRGLSDAGGRLLPEGG